MITVATCTITIRRPRAAIEDIQDPYGAGYTTPSDVPDEYDTVAIGVRAVITPGSGRTGTPGDTEFSDYTLACDPVDLRHTDLVDASTGQTYTVDWAHAMAGIAGLDHTVAGLATITEGGQA